MVSPVDESNGGLGLTTANARQSHDEPTSTELAVAFLRQTVTIDSCGNSLLIPKLWRGPRQRECVLAQDGAGQRVLRDIAFVWPNSSLFRPILEVTGYRKSEV